MDLNVGDRVKITSLTDIDSGESETDDFGLIGRTAKVLVPAMNDYYDCTIQLEEPLGELGSAYGIPPTLAFLYIDLEVIK
jgi:hypothetical protein